MKRAKSLKELRKIYRKYWTRHAQKRKGRFWCIGLEPWVYYISKDPGEWKTTQAIRYLGYEREPEDIPELIQEATMNLGHEIKDWGKLVGLVFTGSAVFWALEDKEGYINFRILKPLPKNEQ